MSFFKHSDIASVRYGRQSPGSVCIHFSAVSTAFGPAIFTTLILSKSFSILQIYCFFLISFSISSITFHIRHFSKPGFSTHLLGVCHIEYGRPSAVALTLKRFMQHKRPFLIAPLTLAAYLQAVQQPLQRLLKHRFQSPPERLLRRTHLLKTTLTDTSGKVGSILLGGITLELLTLLACLRMSLRHICIV